jgi:hypothetical protein
MQAQDEERGRKQLAHVGFTGFTALSAVVPAVIVLCVSFKRAAETSRTPIPSPGCGCELRTTQRAAHLLCF